MVVSWYPDRPRLCVEHLAKWQASCVNLHAHDNMSRPSVSHSVFPCAPAQRRFRSLPNATLLIAGDMYCFFIATRLTLLMSRSIRPPYSHIEPAGWSQEHRSCVIDSRCCHSARSNINGASDVRTERECLRLRGFCSRASHVSAFSFADICPHHSAYGVPNTSDSLISWHGWRSKVADGPVKSS